MNIYKSVVIYIPYGEGEREQERDGIIWSSAFTSLSPHKSATQSRDRKMRTVYLLVSLRRALAAEGPSAEEGAAPPG